MTDSTLSGLPERSVAMVRAFGPIIDRSTLVGGALAVVIAILGTPLLVDRLPMPLGPVVVAAIGALVGMAIAYLTIPAHLHRAYESYSWLGRTETQRFKERTGGDIPTTPDAIDRWLAATPPTPATRFGRVEVLAFIGRHDEARAELAGIEATTPEDRFELASLHQYIDWLETGSSDYVELETAVSALTPGTLARRMGDVNVALADARIRYLSGDPGWSAALLAVRPGLGREASRIAFRDTWLKLATIAFAVALTTSIVVLLLR